MRNAPGRASSQGRRSPDPIRPPSGERTRHAGGGPGRNKWNLTARRPRDSDRKSTRLNSSHRCISYAVFCLKKDYGEDGSIQGLFDFYGIPYSGSGILPSAIGINKAFQKRLMASGGFASTHFIIIKRDEGIGQSVEKLIDLFRKN